jgi:hypothetical protein
LCRLLYEDRFAVSVGVTMGFGMADI